MKKFKSLILDMDGTLLDSMSVWTQLGRRYLKSKGIAITEEMYEKLKPISVEAAADLFKATYGFQEETQQIVAEIYALIEMEYRKEVVLKPGAEAFLRTEYEKGTKLCVATATAKYLALAALERLDVVRYLEFIIDEEEAGRGKKYPDIYEQALERLGSQKEETAVFEDAPYAMRTAKAAGFYTVGVAEETAGQEEARTLAICDCFIDNFEVWISNSR
ncbi:MAG: HAD family phosphatase [Hespellia sp.]|nr:HAD family phosphatase [Hespellia sp.]